MADHGWFSWHFDSRYVLATAVAAAVASLGVSSAAAEVQTTFDRLHGLERRAVRHGAAASRARRAIRRLDRRLEGAAGEDRIARRAQRKLRVRAGRRLVGWSKLHRAAERGAPFWSPGGGADLRRLLQTAEARALERHRGLYASLDRLWKRSVRPAVLVERRVRASVEFAQHRASREKTAAEKRRFAKQREESDQLDRELRQSQRRLEASLERLIRHETGADFHRNKGALLPPVDASPTQGFGEKKQDDSMTYVRHTGLTYRVESGTEVEAVAAGKVVYAQRFEGYGQLAIVDHGDDYHSLYAHLRELSVIEGETIAKGERIGRSGATGSLDGPKLYFELRHHEKPIDPKPWFVRPD